ncbi:MAG: hypothetical protein WC428_02890 [Candidatus Paceibacterota bacterium]|jgi:hypothetical protein
MKLSTILIVAGIIIMIIGGIALMNTIQTEKNKEVSSAENSNGYSHGEKIMKNVEVVGSKLRPHEQMTQNSLAPPIAIIIFGIIVFAGGVYGVRYAPSTEKEKSPG